MRPAGPVPAGDPEPWVAEHLARWPPGTPVLDLACGAGRHGRALLARGAPVTFLDRDPSGVADLRGAPGARLIEADLETPAGWPLGTRRFGLILVVNYLWRPILADTMAALMPGGVLIHDTFAVGNEAFGRPSNPDFLLKPGELLAAARAEGLEVLAFRHGFVPTPKPAMRQGLVARRRDGGA